MKGPETVIQSPLRLCTTILFVASEVTTSYRLFGTGNEASNSFLFPHPITN